MPIYEYRCHNCNHNFEKLRALGDHLVICLECGGDLRHIPGMFSFRIKRGRGYSPETSAGEEGVETTFIGEEELV